MGITSLTAIPIYNEVKYIEKIVFEVKKHSSDILLVDDGSDDGTSDILDRLEDIRFIRHKVNLGYGKSLIDAFDYAGNNGYEWIITLDCDFQHEPAMIENFLDEIKKNDADIISGSRYLDLSEEDLKSVPPERLEINRHITNLINKKTGMRITDAFCGFKAYRTRAVLGLDLSEYGYAMPLELWARAYKRRLSISEISVPLIYHDVKRSFLGITEIYQIRRQYYIDVLERELN